MRGNPALATGLVVLAVIFVILAVLYALGTLQILTSGPGHHYKHAVLFVILAVVSLVGANFARQPATR
jgi:hypothetical protein